MIRRGAFITRPYGGGYARRGFWRRRFSPGWMFGLAVAMLILMPATTGGVHGDVPEKVYTYSVVHPKHGNIGTFRNTIIDDGTSISVKNDIRVQVKVLLVVAHSEVSENQEIWKDGRLVTFSGTTKENGKTTMVTGEADGPKFLVESPDGQKVAPADVYPNNPWTRAILNAQVLLGTKTGKLYRVHADPGEKRDIKLGDRTVATEYFRSTTGLKATRSTSSGSTSATSR